MEGKKAKIKKLLFHLSAFVFFILVTSNANAATLYYSPSSGNFTLGNIFTVSVLVNTEGEAINNSEAIINYPSNLLDMVSVSKTGSIFSLWVEEPNFSSSIGTISYNGGLPTPGFTGIAGKIISFVFKVKKTGSASLIFSSAAVRANDGFGTNVLNNRLEAQFNLISEEGPVLPPTGGNVPAPPQISSPTHPDPEKWYAKSTAIFRWPVDKDITACRTLVGKIPAALPSITYSPAVSERTVTDFKDGIWYFHVSLQNETGWGNASHFRFQIDTENPEYFNITEENRDDLTNPRARFFFDARDKTSGIDHYEVQVDGGNLENWQDDGNHIYETALLGAGDHTLIAKAVDKAGNSLSASTAFIIKALEPPTITEYPAELQSGEVLTIKGETYPNSQVTIWLQGEGKEANSYPVTSQENGKFVFVSGNELKEGTYKMWAEVVDSRGAKSKPTQEFTILVTKPEFLKIGSLVVNFLILFILLIALFTLLVLMILYVWRKIERFKKRLRKEVTEAEEALRKAFDLLDEDIREQIKLLDETKSRRELTEEEEAIVKKFKRDLNKAERLVKKEIKDIEKLAK